MKELNINILLIYKQLLAPKVVAKIGNQHEFCKFTGCKIKKPPPKKWLYIISLGLSKYLNLN